MQILEHLFHQINPKLTALIVSARYTDVNSQKEVLDLYEQASEFCGFITSVNNTSTFNLLDNPTIWAANKVWYFHIISCYNNFIDKTECFDGTPIEDVLHDVFILTEAFIDDLEPLKRKY